MSSFPLVQPSAGGAIDAATWRAYDEAWALLPLDDARSRRLLEQTYVKCRFAGDDLAAGCVAAGALILIASRHADFRGIGEWLQRFAEGVEPADGERPLGLRHHVARMCLPALDTLAAFDGPAVAASAAIVFDTLRSAIELPADERLLYGKLLLDQLRMNKDRDRFETVASLLTPAPDDDSASAYWLGVWWFTLASSYAHFGEAEAARSSRERAWQIARDEQISDLEYALLAEDLTALLMAGDLGAAAPVVARMKALSPAVNAAWRGHGLVFTARYHLLRNEPVPARELCNRALLLYADTEISERERDMSRATLAFCHAALHDDDAALQIFAESRARQSGGQAAVNEVSALSVRACAAARTASPELEPLLRELLARAAAIRMHFVLFLLPKQAAVLFDAALARGIETDFVTHAIRLRKLAPPDPVQENWPWPLRVRALGGFSIERDGARIGLARKAQKKPEELLKSLIVAGGEADVEALIEQLWPDVEAKEPRASFDMALSRLRRLLDVDGALVLADGRLALDRRIVWWDVAAFDDVRLRLHAALAGLSDVPMVLTLVDRLVALHAGDLFGTEALPMWSLAARERLAMAWQRAVQDAGAWLESRSEWRAALAIYERCVDRQMLAEPLYRGLMRCHRALDERAEALLVYRRCRELLTRVLGVPPSEETTRLHELIRGDDRGAA